MNRPAYQYCISSFPPSIMILYSNDMRIDDTDNCLEDNNISSGADINYRSRREERRKIIFNVTLSGI